MNRCQRLLACGNSTSRHDLLEPASCGAGLQDRRNEHAANPGPQSPKDRRVDSRRNSGRTRPYLPSYTDGYAIDAYTQELAKAIVARPGWTVVLFPQIPLGNDPANTIGGKRVFPGNYPIRMVTLRAVYMHLANELGEQGFRWVFLVHNHGAPNHHKPSIRPRTISTMSTAAPWCICSA